MIATQSRREQYPMEQYPMEQYPMLQEQFLHKAQVLIGDDNRTTPSSLVQTLRQSGIKHLITTADAGEIGVLSAILRPDLIVLDLATPARDNFSVLDQLRSVRKREPYLPILMLTSDPAPATKRRALTAGVRDFLLKPVDRDDLCLHIHNLLETRFLYQELQQQNQHLEDHISRRTRELEEAQIEMLGRLALAAEYRDNATGDHTRRVGYLVAQVAQMLGMSQEQVDCIYLAAPLHDVGKIGIPDAILLKPGKLTPPEFDQMKQHTLIGAEILKGGISKFIKMALDIVLSHHEHWDGSGYPFALRGPEIPLVGRITAVVDVFDALTHHRPYKPAWPVAEALAEIRRQRGRHFDPTVVDAFLQLVERGELQLSG